MFEDFVSEKLIEWLWILGSIGVVIFGFLMLFAGGGFLGFLMAVMYVAIGLIVVRVLCESMIIAFKVFENNRRSLAVMEQLSREQLATRQAIQSFLSHVSSPGNVSVQPASAGGSVGVPLKAATSHPAVPILSTPVANAGWEQAYATASTENPAKIQSVSHDQMAIAREQLQQQVRDSQSDSKSKLGNWPGSK